MSEPAEITPLMSCQIMASKPDADNAAEGSFSINLAASLTFEYYQTMEVIVNDRRITTSASTISELVNEMNITTAGVAIAISSSIVQRDNWTTTNITEGCEITLIRATQGG